MVPAGKGHTKKKATAGSNGKEEEQEEERIVIPDPNNFLLAEPIDLDDDEIDVLIRYETIYCAFRVLKVYPEQLKKLLTMADVGGAAQDTIVDYCVAYAFLGRRHVERIQMNMQYTVLQSALILTISMPLYIDVPAIFVHRTSRVLFSAVMGFAAFQQLIVIIGCTIISGFLNRPYADCDGTVGRVQVFVLLIVVVLVNYIACLATLAAMLVAGFARHSLDGYVQLYCVLVVLHILRMFYLSDSFGKKLQDKRSVPFYLKYCEPWTGRLKKEYLEIVYLQLAQMTEAKEKEEKEVEVVVEEEGEIEEERED